MSRLDFEHLLPEDMDPPVHEPDADAHRDSLADLRPVPDYVHRPVTREQLLEAIRNPELIYCGAQVAPEEAA
jgi:hypothetical protein